MTLAQARRGQPASHHSFAITHFFYTNFYRNIIKVHHGDEICPEGRFRTGLRIQAGLRTGSLARAADIPANTPIPFFHAAHLQVLNQGDPSCEANSNWEELCGPEGSCTK